MEWTRAAVTRFLLTRMANSARALYKLGHKAPLVLQVLLVLRGQLVHKALPGRARSGQSSCYLQVQVARHRRLRRATVSKASSCWRRRQTVVVEPQAMQFTRRTNSRSRVWMRARILPSVKI